MSERTPNLFVIGAMKSGTTYLAAQLNAHPAIFICSPEEPSYFVDPQVLREVWPWMWQHQYWRSRENYLALFANAGDASVIGEASTNYTKLPRITGVAERIKCFNPGARFIYLMRDPVERAISHYWHMVRFHAECRSLRVAIEADAQYRDVGNYAVQLRPYIDLFGRDKIYCVTYEMLVLRPRETLQDIYGWLNVDRTVVPAGLERPLNATPPVVIQAKGRGVLQKIRTSDAWGRISPFIPSSVRAAGAALATRAVDRASVSRAEAVEFLRPIQRQQAAELARLIHRDFPEWRTLWRDD